MLVPTPTPDRPLTKGQETFRRLLAKVESLRETIDAEEEKLDSALNFYAAELVPRISKQTALQKDFVRALAPFLERKTFFRHRQERLDIKELVQEFLTEIAKTEKGLTDADLREIYGIVHTIGYDEYERKTLASVKESLAKMFAEAGLQPDFSALESATSEADFMAKAEELIARVRKIKEAELEAARCGQAGHHSSDDEQIRATEEFRKRSIANIYKQLARVLHPDLERDIERQKQKVELMQELTVAFHQNDLHTLLRLQMQWIENEGGDIARLTEEKLSVYIEVLAGQVDGLERRLRELMFHPRYRPVVTWNLRLPEVIHGPDKASKLDDRISVIDRSVRLISAATTADDVRAAIAPLRLEPPYPHV